MLIEKIITDQSLPISKLFIEKNINNFQNAVFYVKNLPYKRNENKQDPAIALIDSYGTCSTKHGVLKALADELEIEEIKLYLGIFKMNKKNTPNITRILAKYNLDYIPEAHCYLRYNNEIMECTKAHSDKYSFISELIEEFEIEANQIADYKTEFHKNYIKNWLIENPEIIYSLDELWAIREECIANY